MTPFDADIDVLLERAGRGDADAGQQLLARHRGRLRQLVACRLDRRLRARLDPSDVVQDVLAEAHRKLPGYLERRPLPFYPWLRQLAWDRLVKLHGRHLHAGKRSVTREQGWPLPDDSAQALAERLPAAGSSPSQHLLGAECRARVQAGLARLGERDREVLVLRYLEQLSTAEIAAVLGVTEGAVKSRHLRALERLRALLGNDLAEEAP